MKTYESDLRTIKAIGLLCLIGLIAVIAVPVSIRFANIFSTLNFSLNNCKKARSTIIQVNMIRDLEQVNPMQLLNSTPPNSTTHSLVSNRPSTHKRSPARAFIPKNARRRPCISSRNGKFLFSSVCNREFVICDVHFSGIKTIHNSMNYFIVFLSHPVSLNA